MGFFKKLFSQKREHAITDDLLEFLAKDEVDKLVPILDRSNLWEARRLEQRLAYHVTPDEISQLTIDQKSWLALAIDYQCPRLVSLLPAHGIDGESLCYRVMMTSIGRCDADELRDKGFKAVHIENYDLHRYFDNAMEQHQRLLLSQDLSEMNKKRRLQSTIQAIQKHYDGTLNEIRRANQM